MTPTPTFSFAAHYAQHWFNPWNVKWFGGFSQTTYPPLTHQWIALFSHIMGLTDGLHVRAVYRHPAAAHRHVSLRAACGWMRSPPAMPRWARCSWVRWRCWCISRDSCPPRRRRRLTLNALPYFYVWLRDRRLHERSLKGVAIAWAAAAAHHVTLLFGAVLFAIPVLVLAMLDRNARTETKKSVPRPAEFWDARWFSRSSPWRALRSCCGPYWIALLKNPDQPDADPARLAR